MMPWDDPTVARGLDAGWRDPRNADDLQRLMQHVIAALPSGGTVLDYGCGTGRACIYFHPDRYVGFDTSEAMLAIARSRFPQYRFLEKLPVVRRDPPWPACPPAGAECYVCGSKIAPDGACGFNSAHMPFPGECADVVFSNSVVQYQPPDRWEATVRDIASRARIAALIETYDTPGCSACETEQESGWQMCESCGANPHVPPLRREGGSSASIWLWPARAYYRVLESFGAVARLMLADDGPVLYTVTR